MSYFIVGGSVLCATVEQQKQVWYDCMEPLHHPAAESLLKLDFDSAPFESEHPCWYVSNRDCMLCPHRGLA
jgi:hypothetical protein